MQFKNLIKRSSFIVAALIVLLLSACKKENKTPVSSTKIKSIVYENDEMLFFYNTDGTVKAALMKDHSVTNGEEVYYNISYNASKQITQVVGDNDEKVVPVYQNGVIVKAFLKTNQDEELGFTEYEYQNNRLKTVSLYTKVGDVIYPLTMMEYTYNAAGNIVTTSLFVQNPLAPNSMLLSGTISYEYDSKANPLANAKEFLQLLWYAVPQNNVIKEIHKDKNGAVEETTEYTYQYNNQLPASAVVKLTAAGQTPVISNYVFSYQ